MCFNKVFSKHKTHNYLNYGQVILVNYAFSTNDKHVLKNKYIMGNVRYGSIYPSLGKGLGEGIAMVLGT